VQVADYLLSSEYRNFVPIFAFIIAEIEHKKRAKVVLGEFDKEAEMHEIRPFI